MKFCLIPFNQSFALVPHHHVIVWFICRENVDVKALEYELPILEGNLGKMKLNMAAISEYR